MAQSSESEGKRRHGSGSERRSPEARDSVLSALWPSCPAMPQPLAAKVLDARIKAAARLGLAASVGNAAAALLVMLVGSAGDRPEAAIAWGIAMLSVCTLSSVRSLRVRNGPDDQNLVGPRAYLSLTLGALAFGVLWGAVPLLDLFGSWQASGTFTASIMVGVACVAAFIYAPLPRAAAACLSPILASAWLDAALEGTAPSVIHAVLFTLLCSMLAVQVRWQYSRFVRGSLAAAKLGEQGEIISLLLRDYRAQASDTLWETDADGRFRDLPATNLAGQANSPVPGHGHLEDLANAPEGKAAVRRALGCGQAFEGLHLRSQSGGCPVVWRLRGKPLRNGQGELSGWRGVVRDVTAEHAAAERVRYLAGHDEMTGLANRAAFNAALEELAHSGGCNEAEPDEEDRQAALVWMDLDNFKWVNDTLGHPTGDECLKRVSARLSALLGPQDLAARMGGDEFAILIRGTRAERGVFLDGLVAAMQVPFTFWNTEFRCGASVGVVEIGGADEKTLLSRADLALYEAKRRGKGNWVAFDAVLDRRHADRAELEHHLPLALERGELRTVFQPIVEASTGALTACEALLRWHHPARGLVLPGDFIPFAEDTGLIARLGEWVLHDAMMQGARLPPHVRVAVNLSPVQLHSTNLVPTVRAALARSGIEPRRVELEITETVLMRDTAFVLDRLAQLHEIGVRISLDDFGTGFSGMGYLRRFHFDKIKLDRSLIEGVDTSSKALAVARAAIGMARGLGLACTAEGVETRPQLEALRSAGCDEIQGFVIGRPMQMDSLLARFAPQTGCAEAPDGPQSRLTPASAKAS